MKLAIKMNSNPIVVLQHATFIRARSRINIALVTLEDGMYDLFTTEDVVRLLSSALSDLDEAQVIAQTVTGLDWNALEPVAGK